jgi:photosystem II stability/assembly factor-like uncharacterized protein
MDGGRTWRSVTISTPFVNSIQFIDARNGWLLSIEGTFAGSNAVAIYHSSDGGETWVKISAMTLGGYKKAASFLDATTGWVTGNDAIELPLFVTHDGGRTWQPQKLPLPSGMSSWSSIAIMPPKFFTTRDGVLPVFYSFDAPPSYPPGDSVVVFYATHNRGMTWIPTTPVSITRVATPVDFVDSTHGWVADGVLYATSDGGRRWVTIQPKQLPGDVTQLDFISPQVGWAIGWAISDKVIPLHKTLDGGRTWSPVAYTVVRR